MARTRVRPGQVKFQAFTNKLDATAAPTINDDITFGYEVGSFWVDVQNNNTYRCQGFQQLSKNLGKSSKNYKNILRLDFLKYLAII